MSVQFCARGSMFDVLAKARSSPLLAQQLDWPKRISMALDAAKVCTLCVYFNVSLCSLATPVHVLLSRCLFLLPHSSPTDLMDNFLG